MPVPFADAALSARIERSVARDLVRYAETCQALDATLTVATAEIAGGIAVYIAPESPIDLLFGAGFDGLVFAEDLDRLERFYAARSARAAISLSPLADESLGAQLGARGWMPVGFENVLVRGLGPDAGEPPLPAPPRGIAVRVVGTPGERARWAGFSAGVSAVGGAPEREVMRLGEAAAARADMTLLLGSVDGRDAGAGGLWCDDRLGWILGDATEPESRCRGVQSALLAERLRLAEAAGCDLAVAEAAPGSTSQRNMERLGFRVVYTRVELIAPATRR